jgi:hypothetical protein
MFQRLAIANGYGWQRFLVNQVLPRRGDTLQLPFNPNLDKEATQFSAKWPL